jgi:membrane-associated phospholipid phosphatase
MLRMPIKVVKRTMTLWMPVSEARAHGLRQEPASWPVSRRMARLQAGVLTAMARSHLLEFLCSSITIAGMRRGLSPSLGVLCAAICAAGAAAGQTPLDPSGALHSAPAAIQPSEPFRLPHASLSPVIRAPQGERPVSWKLLVPNLLHDQKQIWTFPAYAATGKHWKPALGFVAATAGLVAVDPFDSPYFRSTSTYRGFNQVVSSRNTSIGMVALPAGFYALALARRRPYDQHTSLLLGEAVLDAEFLTQIMKSTDRRLRPGDVPPTRGFSDTFFGDKKGGVLSGRGSFPSGHEIAAFSVATILANRYSRHRWVPWVAYGLAGLVGFSRVSLQSHFTSDVFAGAVLGYAISHYVVLQQR